jgi:hypothetical protein
MRRVGEPEVAVAAGGGGGGVLGGGGGAGVGENQSISQYLGTSPQLNSAGSQPP